MSEREDMEAERAAAEARLAKMHPEAIAADAAITIVDLRGRVRALERLHRDALTRIQAKSAALRSEEERSRRLQAERDVMRSERDAMQGRLLGAIETRDAMVAAAEERGCRLGLAAARAVAATPTEAATAFWAREIVLQRLDGLDPAAVCRAGRESHE